MRSLYEYDTSGAGSIRKDNTPVGISMKADGTIYLVSNQGSALKVVSFNPLTGAFPLSPVFYKSHSDTSPILGASMLIYSDTSDSFYIGG